MPAKIITNSAQETMAVGENLAKTLKPSDVVFLNGDLGTGKTTLVKGLVKGFGIKSSEVNSPTFVFLNIYEGNDVIYHFDLYRIEEERELYGLGIEEFLYGKGIAVIEWPDRLGKLKPSRFIQVNLAYHQESKRLITIKTIDEKQK